ncbi:hypothetical protein DPMN_165650 [Dreissena polymorpha]|uniref:Uncharacterized protein n=1 Tax=Dreissena polymorpha TaxID=45954 RepID=A0A9D4F029_DREPO|nr:hypothetical protein DPMN_165650 [Dreissena polymorpha]
MSERHPAARCLHHWPTRALCLAFVAIQAASINWYLMENLKPSWAAMFAADAVILGLFTASFIQSSANIHREKHLPLVTFELSAHLPLCYIAWFAYAIVLDVKIVVIFTTFSTNLDEAVFFGPNTLKTSLAIAGIVFLTFLPTQHDVRCARRRTLITTLTTTVLFDILDGVDILENLFEKDVRESFPAGLARTMIVICCLNFMLPTLPLFTLAKTRFGLKKLPEKLELLHKIGVAYIVNLPLLITRMITWHGLSAGISIFILKNVIVIALVTFELVDDFCCRKSREANDNIEDSNHTNIPMERHSAEHDI